ncbi:hypothetical protein, partial [Rhizorhabdus sp.]|uniref:hypothetical protein n=1 Tax=Rhizorhabdus sp. TaxID=1968843 RepID=UPI0035ADEB9B
MRFGCAEADRWDEVCDLLLPAIRRGGDHRPDEVLAEIRKGRAQLWIATDGVPRVAVVTRIRRSLEGAICEIWLTGGTGRRSWLHFLTTIEAAARAHGCVAMEVVGRPGWKRVLPDYRQTAVILRKPLTEEEHHGQQQEQAEDRTLGAGPALYPERDEADAERVRCQSAAPAGDVEDGAGRLSGRRQDRLRDAQPYVGAAQSAARDIFEGRRTVRSGQPVYDQLMAGAGGRGRRGDMPAKIPLGGAGQAGDPSRGMLSRMATGSPVAAAIASGGPNPGDAYARRTAQGGYLNAQPSAAYYASALAPEALRGNPYLDGVIAQSNANVTRDANRMFGARGMGSGLSSAFADVLSRNLAANEGQLRYQNYNDAANRQLQAAGQSDAAWGGERDRMGAATGQLSSNHDAAQSRALE